METTTVPYNRETVLDDVKAVIKYPCLIDVIHMVPPKYSPDRNGERIPSSHSWGIGTWAHQSDHYLKQALYLDVEPWYYPATEVKISIFTEEEYVKRVLNKGTMMNPKWDEMSFTERCKSSVSVPATEEYIRSSYKEMQATT